MKELLNTLELAINDKAHKDLLKQLFEAKSKSEDEAVTAALQGLFDKLNNNKLVLTHTEIVSVKSQLYRL